MAGVVKESDADEGWMIVAPAVPGDCSVHFFSIEARGYRELRAGTAGAVHIRGSRLSAGRLPFPRPQDLARDLTISDLAPYAVRRGRRTGLNHGRRLPPHSRNGLCRHSGTTVNCACAWAADQPFSSVQSKSLQARIFMTVKLQVRLLVRTLSVPVRGVSRFASLPHGHIADRAGYSHDPSGSLSRSAPFGWVGRNGL